MSGDARAWTIELPLPKVQGSNSRSHWVVRSRTAKSDRYVAFGIAGGRVPRKPLSDAHVLIDWHCPTKRLIDCDNALSRCKSYLDGLTDAGWWEDDRAIRKVTIAVHPATDRARGLVRITAMSQGDPPL
jgi:Holliday junction resolvase RusA-like endonuclease